MGTSSSFGGGNGRNPLIPSWLGDGDGTPSNPPPAPSDTSPNDGNTDTIADGSVPSPTPVDGQPMQKSTASTTRFKGPKTAFNKFVNSGGDRSKMRSAIGGYVSKTAGGSRNAAKRMRSEHIAAGNFAQFLLSAQSQGLSNAAVQVDKGLENKTTEEIYASLVDVICEPGGDLDDSFTRDAYTESIIEVIELGVNDLDQPSDATITLLMERFIARSIFVRILNSIGNKLIALPDSIKKAQNFETQIKQYIQGAVSDAWHKLSTTLKSDTVKLCIEQVYEDTFQILQNSEESKRS